MRALRVVLVLAALCASCETAATEALFSVDTDLAPTSPIFLRATARRGQVQISIGSSSDLRTDASARFPTSFAAVPSRSAPADELVTVSIEAESAGVTLRRLVRFRFVPHVRLNVPVFLARGCNAVDSRCAPLSCTRREWCERQDLTCGDDGNCVDPLVRPDLDAGRTDVVSQDRAFDVPAITDIARETAVNPDEIDHFPIDVVSARDVGPACVPSCTGRMCGPDPVCGTSCGSCSGPQTCDAAGQCACVPNCAGRMCGPDPVCGVSCGGCPACNTCDAAGACQYQGNCGGRSCGPDSCGNGSCGGCPTDYTCSGGGCTCAATTGNGCTPACGEACSNSADCHTAACACYIRCCNDVLAGPFWVDTGGDCAAIAVANSACPGVGSERAEFGGNCVWRRSIRCGCCSTSSCPAGTRWCAAGATCPAL